jgi:hypothetical protein
MISEQEMTNLEVLATARITVTVEIEVNGTWGGKSDINQVYRQAGNEAVNAFDSALKSPEVRKHVKAQIVGKPEINVITFARKRP